MNIKCLSAGILGTFMTLGPLSCLQSGSVNKPREELKNYLSPNELVEADKVAWSLSHTDNTYSGRVAYWDSLLVESKAQKAYFDGQQMIKDSISGKSYTKPKFEYRINKEVHSSGTILRQRLMKEVAKTVTPNEFTKFVKNEPNLTSTLINDNSPNKVHYYYEILSTCRQKEAFEKGANDERANIK